MEHTPSLDSMTAVGREKTRQDHDDIGDNGDQDVSAAQAGEKGEIEEQERRRDTPIDVSSVEDLAMDLLLGVRDVFVGVTLDHRRIRIPVPGRHREVGDGRKGGDEGRQDVEETFLLAARQPTRTPRPNPPGHLPPARGRPRPRR